MYYGTVIKKEGLYVNLLLNKLYEGIMKINKIQEKELINEIRCLIKKKGYKMKTQSIYYVDNKKFIHCDFLIVNHEKIVYRIYIKDCDYDDIFWSIMQMPDNLKEPISLRAIGAFKAPSVLLNNGELIFSNNIDDIAYKLIDLIEKSSKEFVSTNNIIDEYVTNMSEGMDLEVLKCLAYIHMGKNHDALKLAKECIENDDVGRFKNKGKGFFEWMLLVYS